MKVCSPRCGATDRKRSVFGELRYQDVSGSKSDCDNRDCNLLMLFGASQSIPSWNRIISWLKVIEVYVKTPPDCQRLLKRRLPFALSSLPTLIGTLSSQEER